MTKYRVWHIPQVPGQCFYVDVKSPEEAAKILFILADYDNFQYQMNIKPDYTNAQGLEVFNEDLEEWEEWYNDVGDDIRECMYLNPNLKLGVI